MPRVRRGVGITAVRAAFATLHGAAGLFVVLTPAVLAVLAVPAVRNFTGARNGA